MNNRVMQSYVWHDNKCFFVSTIDRECSSMLGPSTYAETIVWEYDYEKRERGNLVHQDGDSAGSISEHLVICKRIHETANPAQEDEDFSIFNKGD